MSQHSIADDGVTKHYKIWAFKNKSFIRLRIILFE